MSADGMMASAGDDERKPRQSLGTGVFIPLTGQPVPSAPQAGRQLPRQSGQAAANHLSVDETRSSPAGKAVRLAGDKLGGMGSQATPAASNPEAVVHRSMSLPATATAHDWLTAVQGTAISSNCSALKRSASDANSRPEALNILHSLSEPLTASMGLSHSSADSVQRINDSSSCFHTSSCTASRRGSSCSPPSPAEVSALQAASAAPQQRKKPAVTTRRIPAMQRYYQYRPMMRMRCTSQPPTTAAPVAGGTAAAITAVAGLCRYPSAGSGVVGPVGAYSAAHPANRSAVQQPLRSPFAAAATTIVDTAIGNSVPGFSTVASDMGMLSLSRANSSTLGSSVITNTLLGCNTSGPGMLHRSASDHTHQPAIIMSDIVPLVPAMERDGAAATASLFGSSFAFDAQGPGNVVMAGTAYALPAATGSNMGAAMQLPQQPSTQVLLAGLSQTGSSMDSIAPVYSAIMASSNDSTLSQAGVNTMFSVIGSQVTSPYPAPCNVHISGAASSMSDLSSNSSTMLQSGAVAGVQGDTQLFYSGSVLNPSQHVLAATALPDISPEDDQLQAIERQMGQLMQLHQQLSAKKGAAAAGLHVPMHSTPYNSTAAAPVQVPAQEQPAGGSYTYLHVPAI